jgi:hypothetical protein
MRLVRRTGRSALFDAGLVERLEAVGVGVRRGGQVTSFRWRPPGIRFGAFCDERLKGLFALTGIYRSASLDYLTVRERVGKMRLFSVGCRAGSPGVLASGRRKQKRREAAVQEPRGTQC